MRNQLEIFKSKLSNLSEKEQSKIMDAAKWAKDLHKDQKRASGEPYFIHPLRVAEILIDMNMDPDTIISALLHDVLEDTNVVFNEIKRRYGKEVANMVEGVTKISILKAKSKSIQEAETIRKMLLAMAKDIRVIIIKLADKLHNMGTLEFLPEKKRKSIAGECLEIYAPLADRLGISWMKAELEDLALKHLNPTTYDYIDSYITSKKSEQSNYLKKAEHTILKTAAKEGLRITASTRAKHKYSIYRKMKSRKKDISEIYDLLGIRILCKTSNECYTLLGIVHKLWPPIEGRFKDYIAMPKANQYQSLHTSVMCYGGRITEIQIRTEDMHSTAENGVAAHWIYKGSGKRINSDIHPIINRFKKWDGAKSGSDEFLADIRREFLRDSIYVFTPNGHIIELPKNSTAIDFAFHIHTEIGTHTIGAKADGSIIPLNQALKNTQVIEIMTANSAKPHVNWLRFVATTRAKNKIRHWLNQHEENLFIDKNIIAKKKKPSKEVPEKEIITPVIEEPEKKQTIIKQVLDQAMLTFKIGDEKNMMISIAKCCHPTTGDDIIGYISRGRGIIVHRKDCPNLKNISEIKDRCIDVEWEAVSPREIHRFKVQSKMTSDLFSEIEGAVRKYKGHLIEGRLEEDERGRLSGSFTMELDNKTDYKKIVKCVKLIPSVLNIQSL